MKVDNRYIAYNLLKSYFNNSFYATDLIAKYLKSNSLTNHDKKFINNLTLGTIRMMGRYDYILSDIYNGDYQKLKPGIKYILYIALYQIDKMESIPNHAAVSVSVEIAKDKFPGLDKLVNAVLRNYLRKKNDYKLLEEENSSYQLLSHPMWLTSRWIKRYGFNKTKKMCEFNNSSQVIWFRINKESDRKSIIDYLNSNNIILKKHRINKSFFSVANPSDLINTKLFSEGKLSIQNPINGFIVDLLGAENSDKIIDGCSAPGGKGSFIAHKAPNAKIYSIDNNSKRLDLVKSSLDRQRIQNVEIFNLDISKDELPSTNKILVDVPCSGTGVINRRVDIKWRRTIDDINTLVDVQLEILENASRCLKKNGILVYSTCSIEEEENELLIEDFLDKHKFVVEDASKFVNKDIVKNGAIHNLPGTFAMDGGYAVRLRKL